MKPYWKQIDLELFVARLKQLYNHIYIDIDI